MRPLLITVLTLVLLSSVALHAHLPADFGKTFVRVDPSALPASPTQEPGSDQPVSADCDNSSYQEYIDSLEQSGGPYNTQLTEPLWDAARCFQEQDRLTDAVALYEKALHIIRINDGLYSARQIPLVRELQGLYRQDNNQFALDRSHSYLFRVHRQGQPPYTPERKQATLEYLRWQREAYALDFDYDNLKRRLELYTINKQLLEDTELQKPENSEWLRELTINQLYNLYLLMGDDLLVAKYVGSSNTDLNSGGNMNSPPHIRQGVANIQFSAVGKGRVLIKSLIELTPESQLVDLANLHLEMGDWLQWNSEEMGAKKAYLKVVELLQQAGRDDLLEKWLGEPQELPIHDAFGGKANAALPLLKASYWVSKRGHVRDLEVSTDNPDNAGLTKRLRRLLRDSHLRPKYSAAGPVDSDTVVRYYQLLD